MGIAHDIQIRRPAMKTFKPVAAAAFFLALSGPLLAQTVTPKVDQRQANQEQRIDQGAQSGTLTGKEAARLEKGQTHVENVETRTQADGKVTARERARLDHAQDVQSRRIAREKRDGQHDFNHDGRSDRAERRAARRAAHQ
jgi:hypothetical protein